MAPLVGRAAHRAVRSRGIASRLAVEGPEAPLPTGHLVVCGYGRVGALVCSLLERMRLPFVVVDDDLHVVDRLRATHVPVVFGDARFAHVLDAAGLGRARVLVLCVPEPHATRNAVDPAWKANPEMTILARSHSTRERDILYARGVQEVVVGENELALELGERALRASDVAREEAESVVAELRRRG